MFYLRKVIRVFPVICFSCFVLYMMVHTYTGTVKETVEGTNLSFEAFASLTDEFESVLQENFYCKSDFVNLNGLVARMLGENSLNERLRLTNGYLTMSADAQDVTATAENIIKLDDFLSDQNIEFLYLLAPYKSTMYDAEFAPGYSNVTDLSTNITNLLQDASVSVIDMDSWFEENGWHMEDVFFKTDHHWLPQAGLAAARCTMELLSEQGICEYEEYLFENESWTITTYEDSYLGSDGARVGIYYCGMDDLSIYLPNFETNYTYSGLSYGTSDWTYKDSIINPDNISYGAYLFGEYPLQIITNTEAINEERILIVGDSFRRAWQYFITTQFQEVYSVDLRYYTDGTLAQYIEEIKPDIVILCTNEATLAPGYVFYQYGIDEYLSALEMAVSESENTLNLGNFEITADDNSSERFSIIYSNLEPNLTYTLTVDNTFLQGSSDEFVQMTLQNLSTNEAVYNRYFETNCEESQKWIFTIPNSNETFAIYLYAGAKGHTENVTASVSDVQILKGISEE